MKVKINGQGHDSNTKVIMIKITDKERELLRAFPDDCTIFASYPEGCDIDEIEKMMEEFKNDSGVY